MSRISILGGISLHYGEHAIHAHYMTILIFFFLGIMFLLLYPLLKERSKALAYTALTSGIVIMICSLYFVIKHMSGSGEGVLRLFRIF